MSCVRLSAGGFRVVHPFGRHGSLQFALYRSLWTWHVHLTFTFTSAGAWRRRVRQSAGLKSAPPRRREEGGSCRQIMESTEVKTGMVGCMHAARVTPARKRPRM